MDNINFEHILVIISIIIAFISILLHFEYKCKHHWRQSHIEDMYVCNKCGKTRYYK
jgi:hypothetical protein